MKYKLLALDVDGTLLDPDHAVSAETLHAVHDAHAAGLAVCLATGRNYAETLPVWRALDLPAPHQPMVLVGGSLVSEPDTGRTLWQQTIPHDAACDFADALTEAGHCAMAFVDPWRYGVDYYLVESGDLETAERDWFSKMDVRVRRVPRLTADDDSPRALRISAVAPADQCASLTIDLQQRFDGRLNVHTILAPNYGVTIVEAFSPNADKFAAVVYVAQALRIRPAEIIAVGDDVNDLAMIRGAGLGAAMPDSPSELVSAADHHIEASLPEFIRQVLAGRVG